MVIQPRSSLIKFELVGGNDPQFFLKLFCLPFEWLVFVIITVFVNCVCKKFPQAFLLCFRN